ncbi:MAG: hypothetical protein PHP92_03800 [Candidatus Nanoarchaeia archaeon]|nr:hypothetical protein [Candidatus Nanoarchaeia archaeon]
MSKEAIEKLFQDDCGVIHSFKTTSLKISDVISILLQAECEGKVCFNPPTKEELIIMLASLFIGKQFKSLNEIHEDITGFYDCEKISDAIYTRLHEGKKEGE